MPALSDSQRIEARQLREDGWSQMAIARHFGVDEGTIRYLLNPERRKSLIAIDERRRAEERRNRVPAELRERHNGTRLSPDDLAARVAAIPPDTRTLTGRLCGDPIPNDPRRVWRAA